MTPPMKKVKLDNNVSAPTRSITDWECFICMEKLSMEDMGPCRTCPTCRKWCHQQCLVTWFYFRCETGQKLTCPMCRQEWWTWTHFMAMQRQSPLQGFSVCLGDIEYSENDENDDIVILDDRTSI